MPTVRPRTTIYLWEFLLQLLDGEENCAAICWVNRERGEFVLKDQSEIAKLWGKVKGRPRMDKIKLGRAMRYYYKKKLLAKVPRRKAVYRFTKFDHLKQKESEIIRHDDFPEIDFNDSTIFDTTSDDKSEGESSTLAEVEVDLDESDTPLERLLAGKQRQVFQEEKCPRLPPVEGNTYENINTACNSFYDYNNNATCSYATSAYEQYYTRYTEANSSTQYGRQTYPSYVKNETFEPANYHTPQFYYPTVDCNNNYQQCDGETGGHLASLLLNSILMSDQQILQDSSNVRENYNLTVPPSCASTSGTVTPETVLSPTLANMKVEAAINNSTAPAQFQDMDTDSTWSTLKELERLLMINRSF